MARYAWQVTLIGSKISARNKKLKVSLCTKKLSKMKLAHTKPKMRLKVNIRRKNRPSLCLARKKVIPVVKLAESLVLNFLRIAILLLHLQTKILKRTTGIKMTQ